MSQKQREAKLGERNPFYGKKHTEEYKTKMHQKRPPFSEKWKENMRKSQIGLNAGEKHWHWKGGITAECSKIRNSFEYKLWRRAVLQRDKWTCVFCGYRSRGTKPSDISADHIKPFAFYPELRFAIDNGRTLCIPCHKKTDTWGGHKKL